MKKTDLEKYLDEHYEYTFYDHEEIEKRGYATILDSICTINGKDEESGKYSVVTEYPEDTSTEFDTLDEALNYVTRNYGKTIAELLESEEEFVNYHIREVALDENGNIVE